MNRPASHGVCGLALFIFTLSAWAVDADVCKAHYSGQDLRWIVPNSTGGSYDTYSRVVGPNFAARLGATVRFENIPGAGGRIGANQIKRARPDGYTLGIVAGTGLLALGLTDEPETPDLGKDFTLLGRIDRPHHIWAFGKGFEFDSLQALLNSGTRDIVFGTPGPGTVSFISIALPAHLLGITPRFVSGYKNSRATKLAALRGEVDVVSHNFESTRKQIKKGELRPLLQLSDGPIAEDEFLRGVPWLGGANGLAVEQARASGQDTAAMTADADAVLALLGLGRLIVAPTGIEPQIVQCMRMVLLQSLADNELQAQLRKRGRSFDPATATQMAEEIRKVSKRSDRLKPVIAAAIANVRR